MARNPGPLQFGLEQLHRSHVWGTFSSLRMDPVWASAEDSSK